MNALQVDPVTGFLGSPGRSEYGFTPEKKLRFLELAKEYRVQGRFPSVTTICEQIGINFSTFDRHVTIDEEFKAMWKNISTGIEYDCIGDMHELRKKNPMYMFGLLRYLNPERWHPNPRATVDVNIHLGEKLLDKAAAIDGELSTFRAGAAPVDSPVNQTALSIDSSDKYSSVKITPPPPSVSDNTPHQDAPHKKAP